MLLGLIGLFLLLILVLIAIRIGINKEKTEIEEPAPVIHTSGIYSIVKRSPREEVFKYKPGNEQMRKYLAEKNEDMNDNPIDTMTKERLITDFFKNLEKNIDEIEAGDKEGCEFYCYDYEGDDPVCGSYISRGQYVTREDIHRYCQIIPPFHLGCRCCLKRQHASENMKETAIIRLRPFLNEKSPSPQLPNWRTIPTIS